MTTNRLDQTGPDAGEHDQQQPLSEFTMTVGSSIRDEDNIPTWVYTVGAGIELKEGQVWSDKMNLPAATNEQQKPKSITERIESILWNDPNVSQANTCPMLVFLLTRTIASNLYSNPEKASAIKSKYNKPLEHAIALGSDYLDSFTPSELVQFAWGVSYLGKTSVAQMLKIGRLLINKWGDLSLNEVSNLCEAFNESLVSSDVFLNGLIAKLGNLTEEEKKSAVDKDLSSIIYSSG